MNYIKYEDTSELIKVLEEKAKLNFKNPKTEIYSEVVIILDNDKIIAQINEIKNKFKNNYIMKIKPYFIPFIIIISPKQIDLSDFLISKTFQYKITIENIIEFCKKIKDEKKKEKDEKKKEKNILAFIRKLNVLFSYYNELGDEFSFINSERE